MRRWRWHQWPSAIDWWAYMWCAQVGFAFPFEICAAGKFFLLDGQTKVLIDVQSSGRARRNTVISKPDERPAGVYNDLTKVTAKLTDGRALFVRETAYIEAPRFLESVEEDIGFSVVYVYFMLEGECPGKEALKEEHTDKLVDYALDYIGRFIGTYRFVTNQVDVFRPTLEDSPVVKVSIAGNYTFTEDDVIGEFQLVCRSLTVGASMSQGIGKTEIPADRRAELSRILRLGGKLHVSDELLTECKELSAVHRNHRLALVVTGTSFETWLQWRVLHEFTTRGVIRYPVNAADDLSVEIPTKNVSPLLKKYVRALADVDVTAQPQYSDWNTRAYLPRNDVIHRGRMDVTNQNVRDALTAIQSFRAYLDGLLVSTRPPP